MLRRPVYQESTPVADPDELRLARDSFERRLRDDLPSLVSIEDFAGWYSESMGRPPCCPVVLTGMLLLQMRYVLTDDQIVERARRDLGFRYALWLDGREAPPSVTSLRRFRRKLRERKGDDFLHRRVLSLAVERELITDIGLQAQDSTNTNCRGAVIDTFNLIAAGIRQVIRLAARALGWSPDELAGRWGMSGYLARSIKGQAAIDWTNEEERNLLLTEEIADADRLPELVAALGVQLPPDITEAMALLQQVARQDVEEREDGTFHIRKGTAKGRIVSITDPEARHGRKTASKKIIGFKTHIQGTIESQFVTGIVISDAGKHDSAPSAELVVQSEVAGLKPAEVVGDAAYGTGANIQACAAIGVSILTKLSKRTSTASISKRDFDIDLDRMQVTCPGGHTTAEFTEVKDPRGVAEKVPSFKFPKSACQSCPLAQSCCSDTRKGGRRSVQLNAYEAELQRLKTFNASSRASDVLRSRSAIERLISHLVRMGMRHARFFGMLHTQYQAYLTSAAYNLQRIFTLTKWSQA